MTASKERKKMKKTVDRKTGARDGKTFVGFWTAPTTKAALQTRAKIEHKSASALIDEILTDWMCGRRRK
jgi:hypothetical protein